MAEQRNEGEGNKTAAREYNQSQEAFVKSGKVDQKAKDAAQAMDGDEAEDLDRAAREGRSHAEGQDPLKGKKPGGTG